MIRTSAGNAPRDAPVFGPGSAQLLVDGRAVAPVAVATTGPERRRGLLGSSALVGALWITRCGSVHTFGMRYPIDVAFLDRRGICRAVRTMRPGRISAPRLGIRSTLEAPAGALVAWGVAPGRELRVSPDGHTAGSS